MEELEDVGWRRFEKKEEGDEISDLDIKEMFKMVDVDKSGLVSRRVTEHHVLMYNLEHDCIMSSSIYICMYFLQ